MSKTITLVAGLSLTVAACGGVEPGLGNPGDPAQDKEGTVHRTIVWLQSDGTAEVKTVEISRAQQQAEVAQRQEMVQQRDSDSAIGTATQAVGVDPYCFGSSLWLFDDYNQTGWNELCLFRTSYPSYFSDIANLRNYNLRYCDAYRCYFFSWAGRVRSYWAGADSGDFGMWQVDFRDLEYFQPWQRVDYAGTVASNAWTVEFLSPVP